MSNNDDKNQTPRRTGPNGAVIYDEQAWLEIESMKSSEKFVNTLFDGNSLGFKAARRLWDEAHVKCFTPPPSEQK